PTSPAPGGRPAEGSRTGPGGTDWRPRASNNDSWASFGEGGGVRRAGRDATRRHRPRQGGGRDALLLGRVEGLVGRPSESGGTRDLTDARPAASSWPPS